MWKYILKCLFLSIFYLGVYCNVNLIQQALQGNAISTKNYIFWPNATVPFYVKSDHFDHEQSLAILTALAMFAFRTCLKFAPVMAEPASNEHVLVFENNAGVRRCVFDTLGHSVFEPHRVTLGYDCLNSPEIDMVIMRALGFPFEHNRINRGLYIDVLEENIEPGSIDLFTKEATQPIELRAIPYDMNSVMHFGPRDFSKNGHRTILFKDHNMQQYRAGLTKLDVRKIEIVYGPECRTRDRKEKLELCQSYPGVARKKRDVNLDENAEELRGKQSRRKRNVEVEGISSRSHAIDRKKRDAEEVVTKSLRVNPDITPPPNVVKDTLSELGIDDAVEEVVEKVYKVSALALKNAREKYCNVTKPNLRTIDTIDEKDRPDTDILGIIEVIANYAQGMVSNAVANLTQFCEESENIEVYQRARCGWNDNSDRCRQTYRSTKSGAVRYSTHHRPAHVQSTNYKMLGHGKNIYARSGNDTDEITTETVSSSARRKRDVENAKETEEAKKGKDNHDQLNKHENEPAKIDSEQNKDGKTQNIKENEENKAQVDKKEENIENNEDKAGNIDDKVSNNKEKDDSVILRTATVIPHKKVNRYEPYRRQGRRHRGRYPKGDEDMDASSLSIQLETNKKQPIEPVDDEMQDYEETTKKKVLKTQHKRKDDIEQVKRKETTKEEDRKIKKLKRKVKKIVDEADVRNKEEQEEIEHTTERQKKKPRKEHRSKEIPRIVRLSKANEEFYNDRKWPGGVVRYVIQEDTTYDTNDLRRRLQEVSDILKRKTCIRLKELTQEKSRNYDDYLVIDNSPDYVTGRVGGRQTFGSIELFRGDQHRQHTAMMVMAMLGFYFEVSRHDRDKYVRVHMRHVRPDKLHHFEKIREDATLSLPYDYSSATQPAWQYWRQLGRTGISTVATYKQQDPDGSVMKSMGQNSKLLSDIDIVKINSVYGDKCLHSERTKAKGNGAETSKQKLMPKRQNGKMSVDE